MKLDAAPSKMMRAAVWRPLLALTWLTWASLGNSQEAAPASLTEPVPAPSVPTATAAPAPLHQIFSVPGGRSMSALRCAAPPRPPQVSTRPAEGGAAPAG